MNLGAREASEPKAEVRPGKGSMAQGFYVRTPVGDIEVAYIKDATKASQVISKEAREALSAYGEFDTVRPMTMKNEKVWLFFYYCDDPIKQLIAHYPIRNRACDRKHTPCTMACLGFDFLLPPDFVSKSSKSHKSRR